MAIENPIDKYI